MKEREGIPNQGNPELTSQPIQATFEIGEIFMENGESGAGRGLPEPSISGGLENNPGPAGIKPEKVSSVFALRRMPKEQREKAKAAARAYLESLGGRKPTFEESQSLRLMRDLGYEPMVGASDTDPNVAADTPGDTETPQIPPPESGESQVTPPVRRILRRKMPRRGSHDRNTGSLEEAVRELTATIRERLKPYQDQLAGVAKKELMERGFSAEEADAFITKQNENMIAQAVVDATRLEHAIKALEEHVDGAETSEDAVKVRENAVAFANDIFEIEDAIGEKEKEELKLEANKDKLKDPNTSINELRNIIRDLAPNIRRHYYEAENKDKTTDMPQSLEELVDLIMHRAGDKWQPKHELALMDEVEIGKTPDGEPILERRVNTVHFYEWIRRQQYKVHDFNSTSEVDFFSNEAMGVKTSFRTINFYEIVFTESFFRARRKTKQSLGRSKADRWTEEMVDKAGLPASLIGQELGERGFAYITTEHTSKEYHQLKNMLLYEVYLLQLYRNGDLKYFNNMSGEKMLQAMEEVMSINPVTKEDYLEIMLTLASMSRAAFGEKGTKGSEMQEKSEVNTIFGEAIRRAWGAYQHIWDYDIVRQYLGDDSPFFQREYDEYTEDEYLDFRRSGEKLTGQGAGFKKSWFDRKTGKLKDDGRGNKAFMKYVNVHLGPSPASPQIKEVRERMVQSIMQATGVSYTEAKIAEVWGWSMTHFTGISALGDTEAVGFDQGAKETKTIIYRFRQKEEKRRAKYGSAFNLHGIKRTILTFMEATRDTQERALFEIVQGGQGGRIDIEGTPIKNEVDFERGAFARDENGYIVFRDKGNKDLTKELKITHFRGRDAKVRFRDRAGNFIEALDGKVTNYSVGKDGTMTFWDEDGSVIEIQNGRYITREVKYDFVDINGRVITYTDDEGKIRNLAESFVSYDVSSDGKTLIFWNAEGIPVSPEEELKKVKKLSPQEREAIIRRVHDITQTVTLKEDQDMQISGYEMVDEGKLTYVDEDLNYAERKNGKIIIKTRDGKFVRSAYGKALRYIVFRDEAGKVVEDLVEKATSFDVDKKGRVIAYYDKNGNKVVINADSEGNEVVENKDEKGNRVVEHWIQANVKVKKLDNLIRFGVNTERQFVANVVREGHGLFEFIMDGAQFDFLGMIIGYNMATGMPIIDTKKLNEFKEKTRKSITYPWSTWDGTDYTKTKRDWDYEYKKDKDGNYITGPDGVPIKETGDITLVDRSLLASMVDDEVLAFIQLEVNSPRRTVDGKPGTNILEDGSPALNTLGINVYRLEEWHDRLSREQKRQLKLAVWEGVMVYLIAKEVEAHRSAHSILKRYGPDELRDLYTILREGEVLYDDEEGMVRQNTGTGVKKVYGEEFMSALSSGNLDGFWQMIQTMIKQMPLA